MGLPFRSRVTVFDIKSEFLDDNDDIRTGVILPAGKEIEVRGFKGYVAVASEGTAYIELCKDDGSDTVICKLAIGSTGHKTALLSDGTTAATFPIRLPYISATATKRLKLRVGGSPASPVDLSIELHISEPGI